LFSASFGSFIAARMTDFVLRIRILFQDLPQWLEALRTLAGPEVVVVLVGNKAPEREPVPDQGQDTSQSISGPPPAILLRRVTAVEASALAVVWKVCPSVTQTSHDALLLARERCTWRF